MPRRVPSFGPPLETVKSQEILDPGQLPGQLPRPGFVIPSAQLAQLRAEFPLSPRGREAAAAAVEAGDSDTEATVTVALGSGGRPAALGVRKEGVEAARQPSGDAAALAKAGLKAARERDEAAWAREEELQQANRQIKAKLRRARKVLSKVQAAAEAALKAAQDTERSLWAERKEAAGAVEKLQEQHERELRREQALRRKERAAMEERMGMQAARYEAQLESAKKEKEERARNVRPLAITVQLSEARAAAARAEAAAELLAARLAGAREAAAAARAEADAARAALAGARCEACGGAGIVLAAELPAPLSLAVSAAGDVSGSGSSGSERSATSWAEGCGEGAPATECGACERPPGGLARLAGLLLRSR
ncbi:hypothetical protein Rsub_02862 [Raphidocelis subcapitata]|uniref:Uncharacterized protein n=1 Tax=Raphidocelis subcapitata TaxID=307507 RepID=A0A2V0NSQ3_9CHLO|nr:hypothetical protein Rsub_02862 [Raphidocelis subcapitata]|eukprot:GBF89692.1 hypothetical protein Rsub_02862 [Raphidocelis subcapitata]